MEQQRVAKTDRAAGMGWVERIFTFSVRRPVLALVLMALATVVTGFGLPRLHIDSSYDSLIDPDDPATQYYQRTIAAFESDYVVVVYLQAKDLFTTKRLRQVEQLTHALEKLDRVEDVRGLFTISNISGANGALDVRPVLDTAPTTAAGLAAAYQRARRNPFVPDNILNHDGTATTISVVFKNSWKDDRFATATDRRIEALLKPLRPDFQAAFQLGPPRSMVAGRHAVLHDMIYIGVFSIFLLVGVLFVFLRARRAVFLPLLTAVTSLYWTLGLLGLMGVPLAMMAAALPAMIIVVGSAEDTHMLAAYLEELHASGRDRHEAVFRMARRMGLPCVLTAATTTAGFGLNGITTMAMMQNSAIALSLGMAINFLATILILPMVLVRIRAPQTPPTALKLSLPRIVERLTEHAIAFSVRYGRVLTWGAIAASLACLAIGFSLKPNTDPLDMLDKGHPMLRDIRTLQSGMNGAELFDIVVAGKKPGTFRDPKMLGRLSRIEQIVRDEGHFDSALSVADHIRFVNREMHGGRAQMYRIPSDPDLVAQYLLLFSRSDLRGFVTPDFRQANILVRHKILNSAELGAAIARIRPKIEAAAGKDLTVHFTGKAILLSQSADSMVYGTLESLIALIAVVAAMIAFAYRSLRFGAIILVPNVLPAVAIFAVMALFGIPLDPGTALAADVALGIAVDDTIHFMNAFRNGLRDQGDIGDAADSAVRDQALPVTAVSLALTACFASLSLSTFVAAGNFGLLCAAAIAIAQPCDLVITPALLRQLGTAKRKTPRLEREMPAA